MYFGKTRAISLQQAIQVFRLSKCRRVSHLQIPSDPVLFEYSTRTWIETGNDGLTLTSFVMFSLKGFQMDRLEPFKRWERRYVPNSSSGKLLHNTRFASVDLCHGGSLGLLRTQPFLPSGSERSPSCLYPSSSEGCSPQSEIQLSTSSGP